MKMYSPRPGFEPDLFPCEVPRVIVPSYAGDEGIVGDWLFYNGVGDDLHDFGPERNHGTLHGPEWVDGFHGWGLEFVESESDYVEVPDDASLRIASAITLSAWIYQYTAGTETYHRSVAIKRASGAGYGLRTGTATVNVALSIEGTWQTLDGTTTFGLNEWHHAVATYNGSDIRVFLDGEQDNIASQTGSIDTSTDILAIGRDSGFDQRYYDGIIKGVRIYDRALSGAEIERMFERTRGVFGA